MEYDYGIEYIDKLRIHELRDFARKMGVLRPTTMKKDELISRLHELLKNQDVIIDTERGKFVRNSEPLDFYSLLVSDKKDLIKGLFDGDADSEFASEGLDNDSNEASFNNNPLVMTNEQRYDDYDVYSPQKDYVGMTFNVSQIRASYSTDIDIVEGYLVIEEKGYGVIRNASYLPTENDVCITKALIKKYHLCTGDKVKGKVKYIIENQPKVMFEVISVDANPRKKNNLKYDSYQFNGVGTSFNFKKYNLDISRGERIYINSLNIADCVEVCNDLIKSNNNIRVKILNIKAKPEESYPISESLELIDCTFNKKEKDIVSGVELVVERIKREFENNKSNVLVLYNFSELINIFNAASLGAYDLSKIDVSAINKLYNILYTAKNYSDRQNVTIICVDNSNEVGYIVKQQFLSLFHSHIKDIPLKSVK